MNLDTPPTDTPPTDTPPVEALPPLIDENLNFSDGYQDRIGEHGAGLNFKNLGDMAKSFKEGQSLIGQLQTEKANLTKQISESQAPPAPPLPADAAAYKEALELPEVPDGVELSGELLEQGIAHALEKGHSPEVFADFLAFDLQRAQAEAESQKNAQFTREAESAKALQELTGEKNVEVTLGDALNSIEALGLPLTRDNIVDNPTLAASLAKLKTSLSEGTLKGASLGGVEITSGGKLSQANDIVSNEANPKNAIFYDDSHPQHAEVVAEYNRLITESAL